MKTQAVNITVAKESQETDMKWMFIRFILLSLVISLLFSGCKVNRSISGKNVDFLYASNRASEVNVDYFIWKKSDQEVQLIWRAEVETFGAKHTEDGRELIGFTFRYKIYHTYSDEFAVDSGLVVMKELSRKGSSFVSDTINLKFAERRRYLLDIHCKDLNSIKFNQQYLDVDLAPGFNHHNVQVFDTENQLMFKPIVTVSDTYRLKVNTNKNQLYVKLYQREFQMAAAPFAIIDPKPFNFNPDGHLVLKRNADGDFYLPVSTKGFYQITEDSAKYNGPSVYFFGEHFPESKTVNDLLYPLRYITTSEEYLDLVKGDNVKKNIDAFWLKIGGSQTRAKELIRAYYSRVSDANRLFTSYLEGWKTDRGMCYMIYGEPDYVYKSTSSETWIYGEEGVYNSLSLTFTKVSNPFTPNDFRLNRSNTLKPSWYRSVEFWRQGRVITYR